MTEHLQTIRTSVKVPFVDARRKQSHFVRVAETEYANPEKENEVLKIHICVPNVSFDEGKLTEKFGQFNKDKVNFVNDVKSFVLAHSVDALRKKI